MKFICAYLLLRKGGKTNPTVEDIRRVINSVQQVVSKEDEKRVEILIKLLNEKDIEEVMRIGKEKLAFFVRPNKKEEKKEEEDEGEEEEVSDAETVEPCDLGLGLFGNSSDSDSD